MVTTHYATLAEISILPKRDYKTPKIESYQLTYDGEDTLPVFISPHYDTTTGDACIAFEQQGFIPIARKKTGIFRGNTWKYAESVSHFRALCDGIKKEVESSDNRLFRFYINIYNDDITDACQAIIEEKVKGRSFSNTPYKVEVMVGPVCVPELFIALALHECDYVALFQSPAPDSPCCYPMANLIADTFRIKEENDFENTKIVAAGIESMPDGMKAFALGADYLMLSDRLAISCFESNAPWNDKHNNVKHLFNTIKNTTDNNVVALNNIPENYKRRIVTDPGVSTKMCLQTMDLLPIIETHSKKHPIPCRRTVMMLKEEFNALLLHTLRFTNKKSLYEMVGNCETTL